jgi:hypothetical protein
MIDPSAVRTCDTVTRGGTWAAALAEAAGGRAGAEAEWVADEIGGAELQAVAAQRPTSARTVRALRFADLPVTRSRMPG